MKIFRSEAIEAKRRRLWGEVRLAQPPGLTIWTLILVGICAALLVALIFGRYTRKESVPGFIETRGGVIDVRAVQAGRVSRVLVSEGHTVAVGAPLVEFTSDVSGLDQNPVLDVHLSQTERQLVAIEMRKASMRDAYQGETNRLLEQIRAQLRLKDILVSQRRVQSDALSLTEADAERLTQLQSQGFAPNAEVDRRRRAVLNERSALADMDSRISAADASVAELRSRLASIPTAETESLASLESDTASLAQRKAELTVARSHVIRAPIAGVVTRVFARDGQAPNANTPLLSVAPTGSTLQARVLVPTRAIGFLEVGQKARLQVDAFPFQRFGFVDGTIAAIHSSVVRPGEVQFPIEMTEAVYEVEIAISRNYVNAYGQRRALRPGMTLRADIPIDRRRLWQQLFDPLLAAGKRSTV